MSPQKKNISIIHNCEEHLFDWLKIRMSEHGISINQQSNLTEVLSDYENEMSFLSQHLKQIQKWNKTKEECYSLSEKLNGFGEEDEKLMYMIERVAFEGQILWLTIQEN
jgi:hypothetical protein